MILNEAGPQASHQLNPALMGRGWLPKSKPPPHVCNHTVHTRQLW